MRASEQSHFFEKITESNLLLFQGMLISWLVLQAVQSVNDCCITGEGESCSHSKALHKASVLLTEHHVVLLNKRHTFCSFDYDVYIVLIYTVILLLPCFIRYSS